MLTQMELTQLPTPNIELGSPGTFSDPKIGLTEAGPFDLCFGATLAKERYVLVSSETAEMLQKGQQWLEYCRAEIPSNIKESTQYLDFPGFEPVFRASLALRPAVDGRNW